MQLDSSYYLGNVPNIAFQNQIVNQSKSDTQVDANKAAEQFTALFIEQMLNDIQPKNSLVTGDRRSPSEALVNQLMNKHMAEIISKNSELKQTFKEQIEKTQK
ncbi:hypothetical protein OTK49_00275 [Vibrio coralliirubri]|uniref:hypothetical protein n=1 Tax=Vibrio coralliirubri TaxID=1516159 RepID=UPI002284D308|nr:hypothetical protein [Vibrio coralliirubri]MCY9860976.1 hypothetical protein [Vibrio coralliirubri]